MVTSGLRIGSFLLVQSGLPGRHPSISGPFRRAARKRSMLKYFAITLGTLLLLGGIGTLLWSNMSRFLEQPQFTLVASHGPIEIRQYKSAAAAEVTVLGDRDEAARDAFRILFRYISGNNGATDKISMTAPVIQSPTNAESWTVAFYLPSDFSPETAPKPEDSRVSIVPISDATVATIRFSGRWSPQNLKEHQARLEAFLQEEGLTALGPPTFAFFNDPLTPPPFRRNEVQIRISG
jgi:effector-binding domain-containing protein